MIIRAFIAIEIENGIKDKISECLNQLKKTGADVKWVDPENIHLTLKFIGYIDEKILPDLNKIISNAVSNISPFSICIENIGAFPTLKKPRVIFVHVNENGNRLLETYEGINRGVESLGMKRESKKFVGHITLGRTRSQKNIYKLIDTMNSNTERLFGLEKVNSISLMQSKLTSTGPVYTKLNNFILNEHETRKT